MGSYFSTKKHQIGEPSQPISTMFEKDGVNDSIENIEIEISMSSVESQNDSIHHSQRDHLKRNEEVSTLGAGSGNAVCGSKSSCGKECLNNENSQSSSKEKC